MAKPVLTVILPPSTAIGIARNLGRFLIRAGGYLMGYDVVLVWGERVPEPE